MPGSRTDAQILHQAGTVVTSPDSHAARVQNGGHIVGVNLLDIEGYHAESPVGHRFTVNGQPRQSAMPLSIRPSRACSCCIMASQPM